MSYWPWWISGLALAGIMLFHWFSLHRMMAVSGRFTALVDRFRHGPREPKVELSHDQLMAAIQAATLQEFGPEEVTLDAVAPAKASGAAPSTDPQPLSFHFLFFGGLVGGGFLSALFGRGFDVTWSLHGEKFHAAFGSHPAVSGLALVLGGVLVGFGTRMAGGCTSGHGLCGTSRLQPGSLLTTVSFFVAGIATSFAIGVLA